MKNLLLYTAIIAAFVFTLNAADDQLIGGDFGNVNHSPFTGDIYGTSLKLINTNGNWSGLYRDAINGQQEQILNESAYDKISKILRFYVIDQDGKGHNCTVKKIRGGILFKLDEKKDEQWQYLLSGNKSPKDYTTGYTTDTKVALRKFITGDNQPENVIVEIGKKEKLLLPVFSDDTYQDGYLLCTWKGKKGFIDQQFIWVVENQVVTGGNVRLRDKPSINSTVILTLAEGTAVQVIQPQSGEWVEVLCSGKQGFINYKYVSR
jgi:SH3-like domain-containing protein